MCARMRLCVSFSLLALAVLAPGCVRGQTPPQRHFRMGFTGFPHAASLQAVREAQQFSRDNADIIAHHIEGVPWAEALGDKPFSDELLKEWQGKKGATPRDGKVY